jgi:mRNA-degrading endonuclease RelE of RelBE toxin-antitoxin system
MELIFRPSFFREFDRLKNKDTLIALENIFNRIEKAESIDEIGNLKKLRNYSNYYRIKIKISDKHDYRLVLMIRNNKVWAESIALASKIFYKK